MTDMTTEQALEWLEGLRNATGDQVCAEIEAGKAAEAAQAFRAALSRPADAEASRTLDALIALAAGDDGLPDDMRADVERLRASLSRPAVPEGWKLVPETMPIGIDDVANLLVMCGDPRSPDEFSDCFLWVGETRDQDGRNSSYGLNVALSEYPEEGSNPFVIFDPPPLAAAPEPASASLEKSEAYIRGVSAGLHVGEELGRRESDWIPVSERLPEEGDDVLIFVPAYHECHVVVWSDGMGVREDGTCFDPSSALAMGFTHWMPLPEPPSAEGDSE